jgi:integrase
MSGPTIQGYLAVLKKLLKLMHKREIIPLIPLFPALKVQYKPRGAFTVSEYISIVRKARELRGVKFDDWGKGKRIWIKENYQVMSDEMHLLIRFMIYTFMRPGDVRQIKHKHVEIIRGKFTYLRLTLPEVKRHNAQVVSLPPAVAIYESQLKRQRHAGLGCPDDHVFFPQETDRKLALGIAGWQFNWILKELDIKNGPHGTERSLYSLRHTAIMFRLLYGGNIDLLTLAKNARTSVEMIEKFYASTLAAETNVSLLHSRRSRL